MKNQRNIFVLLAVVLFPLGLFAKMMMEMPKGTEGTWQGFVTGNMCAVMDVKVCPPNGLRTEVPVLIPEKNRQLDFEHFYYFVALPRDKQVELFNKDVKVSGTLYKNGATIFVKTVAVKENGKWTAFWTIPKMEKM